MAIILDEPELHLHLDKVIDFVKKIESEFPNATLWVATHSIHLLPLFDFDETIYLKDSKIQERGGQQGGFYADIYNSIMGTTEELTAFLQDIASWEIFRFLEQCLFSYPQPVKTGSNDPQARSVSLKYIKSLKNGKKLKILDYGAGKGGFGQIFDKILSENEEYSLDYFTYDLDDKNYNAYIRGKINCHVEHYISKENIPDKSFDYVLLINVLHEISPAEWVDEFRRIGQILKDDGSLIFCEALTLNKGEFLGKDYGFLVLEENSLKRLFGNDLKVTYLLKNDKPKAIMSLIEKNILKKFYENAPDNNITEALNILYNTSYEEYKKLLRNANNNKSDNAVRFENARKLAFYATQQINACLGLDLLNANRNSGVGEIDDVDTIMKEFLDATIPEFKILYHKLSLLIKPKEQEKIMHYLFDSKEKIQRNYAALYFIRLGYDKIIKKALAEKKIHTTQYMYNALQQFQGDTITIKKEEELLNKLSRI